MRVICLGALLALVLPLPGQELADLQKAVSDFKLANGLHFTIVERHQSPTVAFSTFVNSGSVNDPAGQSGLSRLMERTMFNGTETIGSKDAVSEKLAQKNVEEIYDQLEAARSRPFSNPTEIETLQTHLTNAMTQADSFANTSEMRSVIAENGGVRLTASATPTHIEYRYSLPSNRAELWFLLESQHLQHPSFRGFYKARQELIQEDRAGVANLQARLLEALTATAFQVSPYRNPLSGWPTDATQLRMREANAYFERSYVPSNIEIGIAGDITPAEAKRLAEKYFGPIPFKLAPAAQRTLEPAQNGPKTVTLAATQPLIMVGYKRPFQYDKDDLAMDVLSLSLANARVGALYRNMVEQQRLVTLIESRPTHPDGRYPCLFVFMLQPAPGKTTDEVLKGLDAALARFITNPVDATDITRAKAKARALVMDELETNEGLASILPRYVADFGDWKRLPTMLDQLGKVADSDLQRVAARIFLPQNRTVAIAEAR